MTDPDKLHELADKLTSLGWQRAQLTGMTCHDTRDAAAALRACAERLEAAHKWRDSIFAGLCADLEKSPRWPDEQASAAFRRDYPALTAALNKPMEPSHDRP